MISIAILTKNEDKNIEGCLKSLEWCDEIMVIDDFSEDKTVAMARKLGAQVFQHPLNNDFAQQRNFALTKAKGDWVLFVDADERISPELAQEIQQEIKKNKNKAFVFKRQDFFMGKALKHGETAQVRLLRMAKKGGQWERPVHEVWQVPWLAYTLKNPLLHYPHPSITQFLDQANFHSTLHAQVLKKEGVRFSLFRLIFNPLGKFLQNYILRLGFLDGAHGFIMAMMMSLHSFLARGKLFSLKDEKS
ncbi:MAG: glycosyltransferase family 2 protein [Candidatus Marinimicrobia bacterium]|nr:glycosyltransferase family 2 protein [Candidatus Neomarinimicrobiota bacterium]